MANKKYDIRICKCGRIHVMPYDYFDWMEKDVRNREVLTVCQNCGTTKTTYLDPDPFEDAFYVCSQDTYDITLDAEDGIKRTIILSKGIKVPLKKGGIAMGYASRNWFDEKGELSEVNTQRLIKEIGDHDILKAIASRLNGIEWDGTEYNWGYDL